MKDLKEYNYIDESFYRDVKEVLEQANIEIFKMRWF